jgi:hypothetical protein
MSRLVTAIWAGFYGYWVLAAAHGKSKGKGAARAEAPGSYLVHTILVLGAAKGVRHLKSKSGDSVPDTFGPTRLTPLGLPARRDAPATLQRKDGRRHDSW